MTSLFLPELIENPMQIFNRPLDFSFDLGQMVTWYNFSRKQIGRENLMQNHIA